MDKNNSPGIQSGKCPTGNRWVEKDLTKRGDCYITETKTETMLGKQSTMLDMTELSNKKEQKLSSVFTNMEWMSQEALRRMAGAH